VAPILLIFLIINEHTCQLLVGPNALWPTQPKSWVGHSCSAPIIIIIAGGSRRRSPFLLPQKPQAREIGWFRCWKTEKQVQTTFVFQRLLVAPHRTGAVSSIGTSHRDNVRLQSLIYLLIYSLIASRWWVKIIVITLLYHICDTVAGYRPQTTEEQTLYRCHSVTE